MAVGVCVLGPGGLARASEDPQAASGGDGASVSAEAVEASFFSGRGTSPALGAQVYPFAFFADAQPVTALDMVRRLPASRSTAGRA